LKPSRSAYHPGGSSTIPTFIEADFFTTAVFSWNGLVSRKIALQDLVACLQELSLPEREQTAPLIVLAEADSPALA